jgi:hypothetical protein
MNGVASSGFTPALGGAGRNLIAKLLSAVPVVSSPRTAHALASAATCPIIILRSLSLCETHTVMRVIPWPSPLADSETSRLGQAWDCLLNIALPHFSSFCKFCPISWGLQLPRIGPHRLATAAT